LLTPTRIYVRAVLPEIRAGRIKAMAHITGGGLLENVPRVLPAGAHARIDTGAWMLPPAFAWLQHEARIAPLEMARTFNCGIGMVAVVALADVETTMHALAAAGEQVYVIGSIDAGATGCTVSGPAASWGSAGDWEATHVA
jgi:phosphoribosylformylglycinamidine cyclo-ligase